MADLSINIKANTTEASKQFKELSESSAELQTKIKKLGDDMGKSDANKLIEQQKIAAIAYKATGKEVEGLTKQKDAYERKIVSLINKGVDPAGEAIQTLRKEIDNTNKELSKHGVYTGDAAKGVEAMGKALDFAVKASLALGAAMVAMTQKTAETGDAAAKTARSVGMTAETFQELDYAAKQSGVNNLSGSLQKLNKNMSGLRDGSGSLVTALKGNNDALLNQLKTVNSNEEAFDLMMQAIREAPDEFTRTQIATAAFGNAGHDMINMALSGADGIAALREEAQRFGIISNESAAASEAYMIAQSKLKKALEGVQIILTEKLLPVFTSVIDKVTDFIAGIDNWDAVLKTVGITLGVVTVALGAFMLIVKGAAIIAAFSKGLAVMTGAFKALNLAMAANPLLGIAVAITAVLIPAIIFLIKNWDMVQTYLQQGIARLEFAFKWFGSVVKEIFTVAFNGVKIAGVTLLDFIYGNIIRAVGKLLETIDSALQAVGITVMDKAASSVKALGDSIGNLAEETRENSRAAIQAAKDEQDATEIALQAKLAAVDAVAQARRAELDAVKAKNTAELEDTIQTEEAKAAVVINKNTKTIQDRLALFKEAIDYEKYEEQKAQEDRIASFEEFFTARASIESNNAAERIEFMRQQSDTITAIYEEGADERLAIERALQDAINKELEASAAREKAVFQMRLSAASDLASGFGQLFSELGKENTQMAKVAKGVAHAEAGINTALAFTKAIGSVPYPLNILAGASTLAAGIAQQIKIANTPIPTSAETGGSFIVPNLASGVDNVGLRVNPGERIDVTPRGMSGKKDNFNFTFLLDGRIFAEIINKQARAGELYTLQLAGNV